MQATIRHLGSTAQLQCRRLLQTAPAKVIDLNSNEAVLSAASRIITTKPDFTKRSIEVKWGDGKVGSFPFVWLRDCATLAAQSANGNPKSGISVKNSKCAIRTLTLNELNVQVTPESLSLEGDQIHVQWPPYHQVIYTSEWLREHLSRIPGMAYSEKLAMPWGRTDLEKNFPQTTTDELCSGNKRLVREKILDFAKYGVLLVRGGGFGDLKALKTLGYDLDQLEPNKFRNYPHHVQGMHTGGAYKPAIPPLCLLFIREEPEDSTLQICDGYRVAELLRESNPTMFTFLCNTLIEYNVSGKDGQLKRHKWPVFTLAANGAVQQVVFNNALRSSRIAVLPETMEDYYKALKTLNSKCYESRNMVNLHVQKGDLLFIANQRILHGNPAFSDNVNNWVDEVFLPDEPLAQLLKKLQE
jgi:hypothetical protein